MNLNIFTQKGLSEFGFYTGAIDGVMGPLTQLAITDMLTKISKVFNDKKYVSSGDYELIGIRMDDAYTNQFTDWGVIVHGNSLSMFPMSSKPGAQYFLNEQYIDSVKGCACLVEGQYPHVWRLSNTGWSKMPFLAQVAPVTVYRDSDRDYMLDRVGMNTGMFGINFHSWAGFFMNFVQNLSAGCQVTQADVHDMIWPYIELMAKSGDITYTLLHFNDFK